MIHQIRQLIGERPVIGFGCGELVDRAIGLNDLAVEYFIDNERAGDQKWNIPIYHIDRLQRESRDVVIFVFTRHVSMALLTLAQFGYIWGRDVFDGRYFGLSGPYYDNYVLLPDLAAIETSKSIELYLGPSARVTVQNLILPQGDDPKKIKIYVGSGAKLELRSVVLEEGVSIFAGNRSTVVIGEGSIIRADCQLSASSFAALNLGCSTLISPRSVISAATGISINIGSGSTFGERLQFYGYAPVTIGRDCMFSGEIYVGSGAGHDFFVDGVPRQPMELTVGDHVWVGMGAALLAGSSIGRGAVVGARSVLTRAIGDHVLAVGNPARVVRKNIRWDRDFTAYKELYHRGS